MLFRLYPDDILKREEVKRRLTMEDLIVEDCLKQYDRWAEEQVYDQRRKEHGR